MFKRFAFASAIVTITALSANGQPQGFMVGCTIDSVNASHAYRSQAVMLRDPSFVYVMIPIANEASGGITLIPMFNGVNAGAGDQYRASTQLETGFVFTRFEPAPGYDTNTTRRDTEISVPLDFSTISYLERMWRCVDGNCSVDTLTFTASCSDPRPL